MLLDEMAQGMDRRGHPNTELARVRVARDDAAIIIAQDDDRAVGEGRTKDRLAARIEIVTVSQGIHSGLLAGYWRSGSARSRWMVAVTTPHTWQRAR